MWYNRLKIGKDDVGSIVEPTSSLVWADVIRADIQTVISHYLRNIIIYLFCAAQRRTIFMQKSKPKYVCLPSKIVEVWAILRPLWLMTSAAADVISVPSVICVAVNNDISPLVWWFAKDFSSNHWRPKIVADEMNYQISSIIRIKWGHHVCKSNMVQRKWREMTTLDKDCFT